MKAPRAAEPAAGKADDLQAIVTRNIRVAMALRGVNQKDLAKVLGIATSSMSQKFTGKTLWNLVDIEKASGFFNVKPEALVAGHVEQSYVNRHISKLLPAGWGCHSLRHRYATKTYEQTHDLFLVARLLGHASVETTQIYVAMPDSRLREALDAVIPGA